MRNFAPEAKNRIVRAVRLSDSAVEGVTKARGVFSSKAGGLVVGTQADGCSTGRGKAGDVQAPQALTSKL